MKKILSILILIVVANTSFAQFANTDALKQYITDTIKDRRPAQITAANLQKAFLGVVDAIPGAISTGNTFVVSSQSDMLLLNAAVGDVAVRTDSSKSYILQALPASTLSNWVLLLFPANVNSVNGRTGVVTAQSGDYAAFYKSLSYVPTWNEITGKPTIPTNNNQLTNGAGYITSAAIAGKVNIADTLNMLKPYATLVKVKGDSTVLQTAINGKQATLVSGTSIKTLNGNSLLGSGNISITAGTGSNDADSLSGQPGSYYAPVASVVPKTTTVNGHALSANVTVTKSDVGLSNVDNTSDLNKPVSTATQTALNAKQAAGTYATGTGTANGTNTGDETATTIKSKLGITTLSGSNTGDQDLSGLVPKTTAVNGHALSAANVIISATDITTGTLPHAQLPALIAGDIPNIAESQVTNLTSDLSAKQATLVSGTNLKTVGGNSLLGSGDIPISGGGYTLDTTTANTGLTNLYQNNFNAKDTDFIIQTIAVDNLQNNSTGFSSFNGGVITYDGTNKRLTVSNATLAGRGAMFGPDLLTGHRYYVKVNIAGLYKDGVLTAGWGVKGILTRLHNGDNYGTVVAGVGNGFGNKVMIIGDGTFYINSAIVQEIPLDFPYATRGDNIVPNINIDGSLLIGAGAVDSTEYTSQKSTVIGINSLSAKFNSVVIGEGAKAFNSPYASSTNGEATAVGYLAQAGDWRAIAIGGRAQALAVSSSAFGYGAYVNVPHAEVWGRGGYNPVGGTLFYADRTGAGNASWFFGSVGAKFLNPAMPGGEQSDVSSFLQAGTLVNSLRGVPGVDLMPTPTLTNIRGGYMRLAGGQSTGTAAGGNAQISVTLPGATSNNTVNPDFVAVDVSGQDGTVKLNAIPTGTLSDSVLVSNGGTIKKVAQSSISGGGGYVLDTTTVNTGLTTLYQNTFNAKDTDFVIKTIAVNDLQTNSTGFSNFNGATSSYDGTNKRLTVNNGSITGKGVFFGSDLVEGHRYTVHVNVSGLNSSGRVYETFATQTIITKLKNGDNYGTITAVAGNGYGNKVLILGDGTFYINYIRIQEVPVNYEYATKGDLEQLIPSINLKTSVIIGAASSDSFEFSSLYKSTVIGVNAWSSKANSVVLGEGAKAFNSPYTSAATNGEAVAIGFNTQAGDWRSTAIGAKAQALGASSIAVGHGAYVINGQVYGKGGYNSRGGVLFYTDALVNAGDHPFYFGSQDASHTNPANGETTDYSTNLNAGNLMVSLRGVSGIDTKPTPTLTNIRGGYMRLAGGQSTGTAAGGNAQISVTLPGATSNNTVNPDFVAVDVSGQDGTVKLNAIPTGTLSDSVLVSNGGTIKKVAQSSISGGGGSTINGTGFVKAIGTTISYDNNTYLTTSLAGSTYATKANPILTGVAKINSDTLATKADVRSMGTGASGSYTPTFTLTNNIGSVNFHHATYMQIGNIVSAKVYVSFAPTANGNSTLTFTLPINSTNSTQGVVGYGYATASTTQYTGLITLQSASTVDFTFNTTNGTQAVDAIIMLQYEL